jgi:hypothetical protein
MTSTDVIIGYCFAFFFFKFSLSQNDLANFFRAEYYLSRFLLIGLKSLKSLRYT